MIRDDTLSITFTVMAVAIIIYLLTFENGLSLIAFPLILLLSAIVLEWKLPPKDETTDHVVESSPKIIVWTIIAMVIMLFSGLVIQKKFLPQELSIFDKMLYGVLAGVSEERFFRKTITDWFLYLSKTQTVAIFLSSLFFTFYHFARYGLSMSALLYVFMGGVALAYVAIRSGRISPTMLAHVINNVLAVM